MTFSQDIPDVLRSDIVVAYTDTDGDGQRADRRPPGAEQYYREIDAKIQEATGRPRNETVVLTADYSFLSYYPYYGFQGLTSHYANPLAQFDQRAAAIESWATLTDADQFIAALDALPWKPPTVFLMRRGAERHLHAAAGLRRLPEPAQRAALPRRRSTPRCSTTRASTSPTSGRSCWPSGKPRLMAIETPPQAGQLPSSPVTDLRDQPPHRAAHRDRRRAAGRGAGARHPAAAGQADHRRS